MRSFTEIIQHPLIRLGSLDCAFPKMRGTFFGVPIIRTIVFGGLYWGPPNFGKLPYSFGVGETFLLRRGLPHTNQYPTLPEDPCTKLLALPRHTSGGTSREKLARASESLFWFCLSDFSMNP